MRILYFMLSVLFPFCSISSQETLERSSIIVAGSNFENDTFCFRWTLGETFANSGLSGPLKFTIGFEQPDQGCNLLVLNNDCDFYISAYPNPIINDFVFQLTPLGNTFPTLSVKIYDVLGHLYREILISHTIEPVDFSNIPSGVYLLVVRSEQPCQQVIKLEKLIK